MIYSGHTSLIIMFFGLCRLVQHPNAVRTVPYMLREMIILLSESAGKGKQGEKHVSSFQAFANTIASRVGTGNLAGGGHRHRHRRTGSCFLDVGDRPAGASSAFIESTLAQLYKIRGKDSFVGGPAYYMKKGLKQPWMGDAFRCSISITLVLLSIRYRAIRFVLLPNMRSDSIIRCWEECLPL